MTRKIPDLFDDYLDTTVSLPDADFPTAQRTKELTMKKIKKSRPALGRIPRAALIAAATVSLLTISVAAVGFTLWDRARSDLGIMEKDIPEYTEYSAKESESISAETTGSISEVSADTENDIVEGASIELISTLCTGNQVTAYLAVSPVTAEMAEAAKDENQGLYDFAIWNTTRVFEPEGTDEFDGYSCLGTQVEYDVETCTALVKMEFQGNVFSEATAFTVGVAWDSENSGTRNVEYFGTVYIPITRSEGIYTPLDVSMENTFLPDFAGTLTAAEVQAGYVSITIEIPSFTDVCNILGEDAYYIIGDAYENYYRVLSDMDEKTDFTELDASVYYNRSWCVSIDTFLADAALLMKDGSSIPISSELGWSSLTTTTSETAYFVDQTTFTSTCDFSTPLDLSQIESIVIDGVTYPLEAH